MKRIASLLFLAASALIFVVHCSEPVRECGKDVNCGDPGDLAGKVAPGPPNAAGTDSNNTKGGADAATSTLCPNPVNPMGTGCTISFTKDILQKKLGAAAGTWGCAASGCHDPQGGIAPKIDVSDPTTTYGNLYRSGTTNPYVNPCSKDATKSDIMGNLANPSTAGNHMPKGVPAVPTQMEIDTIIKPWVECGAPLN
jgi:hypothetical protein